MTRCERCGGVVLKCGWDGEAQCLLCGHDNDEHPLAGSDADKARARQRVMERVLHADWFLGAVEPGKRSDKAS